MTDTRRRVKLYALNADRQWDDRGTGHVSSAFVERLKGISLLVRAESDGSLLLESRIQLDTAYQKQQDTLIVWSEGDNFDLALSFQEKAGCDEIWEKICQVQGKDPSVEITQDMVEESEDERFDDMSDTAPPIELPPCELSRLENINELFASCLNLPVRKDKLAEAIEQEGYIRKLLNLFHMCEDLDNSEGLHHLYEIFKNIFLLNKNALFDIMFSEDTIFDVVGCLEYDPNQSTPKNHRQYLRQQAKFREAIPIRNAELLAKIHQTFRVQYIQDVVIPTPSVFEDNMISSLASFIYYNKVEIVTVVQEDEKFLTDLFNLLTDENANEIKKRDTVMFLKEFCSYSQNLQQPAKETFYKTLTNLGILSALETALGTTDDSYTKLACIDILTYIVEHSPTVVREYMLQQVSNTEEDQMLLNVIIEQMVCDSDPELGSAMHLGNMLRILLDPENMLSVINKNEKSDFLNYFYKHCFQLMIAPLLANTPRGEVEKDDYQTVQLLSLILDILSFCVEHHSYHIKNNIFNKDLLGRILILMKSTHKFLVLCALRFMRKLIALKDDFYNRYIIKNNLFKPVVDAFINNKGRYNLLDSAILELFEYIKLEDIRILCTYVMENFGKFLEEIQYVQTFKALKQKFDQQQDKFKDWERTSPDSVPSILRSSGRYRRDQRQLEEEEEMWFDEEDDPLVVDDNCSRAFNKIESELDSSPREEYLLGPNIKKLDSEVLDSFGKMVGSVVGSMAAKMKDNAIITSSSIISSTVTCTVATSSNSTSVTNGPSSLQRVGILTTHNTQKTSANHQIGENTKEIDTSIGSISSTNATIVNTNEDVEVTASTARNNNGELLGSSWPISENEETPSTKCNATMSVNDDNDDNASNSLSSSTKNGAASNNINNCKAAATEFNYNLTNQALITCPPTPSNLLTANDASDNAKITLFKKRLVDYEGDSDEDEEDGELASSTNVKRQKLS